MTTLTLVCALLVPVLMGWVTAVCAWGGCFDRSANATTVSIAATITLMVTIQTLGLFVILGSSMGIVS